jgi:hypothetical protein
MLSALGVTCEHATRTRRVSRINVSSTGPRDTYNSVPRVERPGCPSAPSRGSGVCTNMTRLCTQVLNVRLERITTSDEHQDMLNMSTTEMGIDVVRYYVLVLVRPV